MNRSSSDGLEGSQDRSFTSRIDRLIQYIGNIPDFRLEAVRLREIPINDAIFDIGPSVGDTSNNQQIEWINSYNIQKKLFDKVPLPQVSIGHIISN